jgi:hypothetical protein
VSDLGPIDPQFQLPTGELVGAKDIIAAVDDASEKIQQAPDTYPLYASLLSDVTALMVQQARAALARTGDLLIEALRSNPDRSSEEVEQLRRTLEEPLIKQAKSHGAIFGYDEAKKTNLPVVAVDPEHSPVADHLETVGEVFRAREPLLTKVTGPHKRCPSRRSLSPPSNKKRSAKWETYRRAGRRAERLAKNASHPPGRASRYASSSRPASRSLGHGSKCQRCILAAISGEGGEAGRDQRNLVDRCVGNFLEVAEQPARGDARVPGRVVARRPGRRARPPCSEYAERPWTADFRRYKTSYWWLRCAWGAQNSVTSPDR